MRGHVRLTRMRIGWSIPLPGPFRLSGTLWRSGRRRRVYHGTLPGWKCRHRHSRPDLARACAQREAQRRRRDPARKAHPLMQPTVRDAAATWRYNRQQRG